MPRATLFDPANALVTWEEARDLSEITGLGTKELATFRAARHALHHVLIRVTAETHVPDGPAYADLGINLRSMAADIYEAGVLPELAAIEAEFEDLRARAKAYLEGEFEERVLKKPEPPKPKSGLSRWFGKAEPPAPQPTKDERALDAVKDWSNEAEASVDTLEAECCRALARVVGAVLGRRGSLSIPDDLLISIAVNLVSNELGDQKVGDYVGPLFDKAVKDLGLKRLPDQMDPVVLNAKGASASGKSSIRGQQRQIAENLGIDWQDFAIISPDYWRKQLIDYDSLGEDYKYAAMLTGQELEIIDRKLDLLMAQKAASGHVPHMLIDRFRFDSFLTSKDRASGSKLLTRFGNRVFMFFMVTPPEETVARAWSRGLETGRYKAVDDLLFHNIEAYSGMPDLFLSWANSDSRWVHYEFLDNGVEKGEPPRTIAFGQNGSLIIRDLDKFCDIERFRYVNLEATGPAEVLSRNLSRFEAMAILRRVSSGLTRVEVLAADGHRIFAKASGKKMAIDPGLMPEGFTVDDFGACDTAEDLGSLDPDLQKYLIGG